MHDIPNAILSLDEAFDMVESGFLLRTYLGAGC